MFENLLDMSRTVNMSLAHRLSFHHIIDFAIFYCKLNARQSSKFWMDDYFVDGCCNTRLVNGLRVPSHFLLLKYTNPTDIHYFCLHFCKRKREMEIECRA